MKPGKGKVPDKKRKLRQDLAELQSVWQGWLDAGMPQREPLTHAELTRRIALIAQARTHLSD